MQSIGTYLFIANLKKKQKQSINTKNESNAD
jgi:hypothetical protein